LSNYYGGQGQLTFTNRKAIIAMGITIKVALTTGVTYDTQYNALFQALLSTRTFRI
jgi:phosphoheptose isomerase